MEYRKVIVYDENLVEESKYYNESTPNAYATILAKLVNSDIHTDIVSYNVLKVLNQDLSNKLMGRGLEFGDYLNIKKGYFIDTNLSPEEIKQCEILDKKFEKLHKDAPYKIIGSIYSENPTYYDWDSNKKFPNFEEIKREEWMPDNVHSLDDCEKWILENHPSYYMGFSATQQCPSGNFRMGAVPCGEYPKGRYETIKGRELYAKERAEKLKITLGQFETDKDISLDR